MKCPIGGDEDDRETLESKRNLADVLMGQGDDEEAESILEAVLAVDRRELGPDHWQTRSTRSALAGLMLSQGRIDDARVLYGRRTSPQDMGVERWLQGHGTPGTKPLTMVAALESWCPYSVRALPGLEDLRESYGSRGLEMIGVTMMSQETTDEKIQAFLQEGGVTFPLAKVTEEISVDLYPGSVPHMLVAKGSDVIWEGLPASFPREALDRLLAAN